MSRLREEGERCNSGVVLRRKMKETVNAAILESAEFEDFSIVDEYLSEPEETLDVSLHKLDITIAHIIYDEVEKDIEVISERQEEPQKEKEHSQIFYTADTFVSDDRDATQSNVLVVPNELLSLKEGMPAKLPKAIDVPFIVDISKGEGIT
ncbi:hypothetical protein Sjap_005140 [Stephania japonica]|uniref:Uncharacterized protein n=1 Tax=Stephania japonica TaxID=461633 RepID=A0AAP0PIG3_9MAGN